MGCFFNKPAKELACAQNSKRKFIFDKNSKRKFIFDKNSINTASHTPLSMMSCVNRKNQYEVSTSELSISSISMMDLVLHLGSLKIETSNTKKHKIEHYHDPIPYIEPKLKKKKIDGNIVMIQYKKNNIKQPAIGFTLLTDGINYKKKMRSQKEYINNIFYREYIKQQEIDNLFKNNNCLLNTH